MVGDTHYEVLGVDVDADVAAVRKAYLNQARQHHPDFHVGDDETVRREAEATMRSLNQAWAVLGDRSTREKYDRELRNAGRLAPAAAASGTRRSSASSSSVPGGAMAPDTGTGTAPPRWITIAPALCLVLALGCFVMGFVTGLPGVLAAGLLMALVGAGLFLVAPMVALSRSKREDGQRGDLPGRDPRPSSSTRKRRHA